MLYQSAATLAITYAALVGLGFLSVVRIRSIWSLRRTDPPTFRRALPSWAASFFGLLGILSLGLVIPLEMIDAALGGSNVANLLQSSLTVLAFWFFRESVREVAFDNPRRLSRWVLLALIVAFSIPFFLIGDRGRTSSDFMAQHAHDLGNIVYNAIYMAGLAWIVGDMIWTLRKRPGGAYALFRVGLALVLLAAVDEIIFITTATFTPSWFSTFTHDAFYVLFFGGILIVLVGWTWVLIAERNYLGQLRFRFDSLRLGGLMLRVRRRRKRAVLHRLESPAREPEPSTLGAAQAPATKPRLRVEKYISGASDRRSALRLLTTESGFDVLVGLLGVNAEDVAYRLVVYIRNLSTQSDEALSDREEEIVARVENRYPGYEPAVLPS